MAIAEATLGDANDLVGVAIRALAGRTGPGLYSDTIEYHSQRTHSGEPSADFEASHGIAGEFFESQPGSLEHWLTARYCLYSANRKGRIFRGEIDHPPWTLAPGTYAERTNTMGKSLGIEFRGDPHLLFAKPVDVRAWIVTHCDDESRC